DTMEKVYVPKSPEEKRMQRALLQYRKAENARLVEKAYRIAGKSPFSSVNAKKAEKSGQKKYTKSKKYDKIKR
ncbi:MAG: DUF3362 domain-containing protein, partial [Clostridia bacterium]|nr:DUF3362 domain-containing protein [Clostridia bacterium]